jgi:hypothetical protein
MEFMNPLLLHPAIVQQQAFEDLVWRRGEVEDAPPDAPRPRRAGLAARARRLFRRTSVTS